MKSVVYGVLIFIFINFNLLFGGITNIENDRLILDNASLELYGSHTYKRISLVNSSTLYIKFSALSANGWGSLELNADSLYIDGTSIIYGKGKGGVPEGEIREPSNGSGGSYGGNGGISGCPYATTSISFGDALNIYKLSQGENGACGHPVNSIYSALGGYGGGKLIINCTSFTLNGTIDMSGEDGELCSPGGNKVGSGGGGAGGGIGIIASNFSGSGIIYSTGGDGGRAAADQTIKTNYGGGGGAGGRVIIAYKYLNFNTNNIFVTGGNGGISTNTISGLTVDKAKGAPGGNGTIHITKIPSVPIIISPSDNGDSLNPPVFKIKAYANDNDKLYFKIELSENNFITYSVFNQYTNQTGWSKNYYESGETAVFTLPYSLEPGKIYQWRVYTFDGSVFSEASSIYTFKCGAAVNYEINEGENNPTPKILTLNNDGVNDYVKFDINTSSDVYIEIYNIYGELVRKLDLNQTEWDGKDNMGNYVSSGAYIVQIHIGNKISNALVNVIK